MLVIFLYWLGRKLHNQHRHNSCFPGSKHCLIILLLFLWLSLSLLRQTHQTNVTLKRHKDTGGEKALCVHIGTRHFAMQINIGCSKSPFACSVPKNFPRWSENAVECSLWWVFRTQSLQSQTVQCVTAALLTQGWGELWQQREKNDFLAVLYKATGDVCVVL